MRPVLINALQTLPDNAASRYRQLLDRVMAARTNPLAWAVAAIDVVRDQRRNGREAQNSRKP
jgi:hypothetical protein